MIKTVNIVLDVFKSIKQNIKTGKQPPDISLPLVIEQLEGRLLLNTDLPNFPLTDPPLNNLSDQTIVVGDHALLPNLANQIIPVMVSGVDSVTGFNLRAQIGDGMGPAAEPIFSDFDFTGGIWDEHPNTVNGGIVSGAEQFLQTSVIFNETGDEVVADGLIVKLGIDTTGFTAGTFNLSLANTQIGADTAFILSGGTELPIDIINGTITIVSSNHAPLLDHTGDMYFTSINEDDTTNNGDLVVNLIASAGGDRITDADVGDPEGISVISVADTNGTWQYSINGGSNWMDFGVVSDTSAVLLGSGNNDRIRFVPNLNYQGITDPGIMFRAWDQTDGHDSGITGIDVSNNGGTTAYSTATESARITVNAVNDPPTVELADETTTLPEDTDTSIRLPMADIVVTDDGLGTNVLSLSDDDASLFEIDGMVLYLKAGVVLDYASNPQLDVTVEVDDTAVGVTPDDTAYLSVTITDVNEAPTVSLANTTTTLPEDTDTSSRLSVADIVVTDDGLGTNILSLSGDDASLFEIDGMVLYLSAGAVLDYKTNPQLDVTVEVDDATVGVTPDDTAPLSIEVTDVNEAPTVSLENTTTTLPEDTDTSTRLKVADIVVTDDDLGTNILSLSNDDASLFEIDGIILYLKSGAVLDYETNPQLDVTVKIDDATVGVTPDDTAPLSITVTEVNEPLTMEGWSLNEDTGFDETDKLTYDTTPELVFTFSSPVWGQASDIQVEAPTGNSVSPDLVTGWGSGSIVATFNTPLSEEGQYTVTLKGNSTIEDGSGNPLNDGSDEVVYFSLDTTPPKVHKIIPEGIIQDQEVTELYVEFDPDVYSESVLDVNNYELLAAGGDSVFGNGNDDEIAINSIELIALPPSDVIKISIGINNGQPLPDDLYRLSVKGSTSVEDEAGNLLDGNNDGTSGDDYETTFRIGVIPIPIPRGGITFNDRDDSLVTVRLINGNGNILFAGEDILCVDSGYTCSVEGKNLTIASIDLTSDATILMITASGGEDNKTELGGIACNNHFAEHSISRIITRGVDLKGNIELNSLGMVMLNDILEGGITTAHKANGLVALLGNIEDQAKLEIADNIRMLMVNNVKGALSAEGDIGLLMAKGDITGHVRSGHAIGTIMADNLQDAILSSYGDIRMVNIKNDISNSKILAGYDIGSDCKLNSGDEIFNYDGANMDFLISNRRGNFENSYVMSGIKPFGDDFDPMIDPELVNQTLAGSGKIKLAILGTPSLTSEQVRHGIFASKEIGFCIISNNPPGVLPSGTAFDMLAGEDWQ